MRSVILIPGGVRALRPTKRAVRTHASPHVDEVARSSRLVGDAVVYFTLGFCSLNWMYYRNLRKKVERLRGAEADDALVDEEDGSDGA